LRLILRPKRVVYNIWRPSLRKNRSLGRHQYTLSYTSRTPMNQSVNINLDILDYGFIALEIG